MKSKIFLILISIFIILSITSVNAIDNDTVLGDGQTVVVDGSATNQMNNPTIQNAINSASDGDTIQITGSEYEHCHIVVDKNLTIISTVGTKMETCPSNIDGSDGVGVFYFTQKASGSVLSGFTFVNENSKRGTVNPYGVYINGADDITVINCNVNTVSDGNGIYIKDSSDIIINNVSVKNADKGIFVEKSKNITIENSQITKNKDIGLSVGVGNEYINILNNTVSNNNWKGIYLESVVKVNITGNLITANRDNDVQSRATQGAGIFVNSTIDTLKIKGNAIIENGNYGVYNSYLTMPSLVNQHVEEIDENIFIFHLTRGMYTQQTAAGGTGPIYTMSNFYSNEQFCPSTYYEAGLLRDGSRDLIFSNITQDSKGVYTVSFIKKNSSEVATFLNQGNVTFFLNKKDLKATISSDDTAKIVKIENGSATVSFKDSNYLTSNNNITAISQGYGAIDFKLTTSRLSAIYYVSDSDIPSNSSVDTILVGEDIVMYYKQNVSYIVNLKDSNNNVLKNQTIIFKINGAEYNRTTDGEGNAKIKIGLNSANYTIEALYNGVDDYEPSKTSNTVIVNPTVSAEDVVKIFRNNTQYYARFTDSDGKLLSNGTAVEFNINGVFYKRNISGNGTARLNLNLEQGNYILTAINPITKENYANNITVLPTITENKDVTKYYRNDTQYYVQLLQNDGSAVGEKVNVTFNINGVFYTRSTNQSGYARLNLNLEPGEYIITAEYNNCRISNKINILPVLSADNLTKSYGTSTPFTAKLVNGQGGEASYQNITFNINGVFYTRLTNVNGIATLNINLQAGKYIITSSYNGSNIANTVTVT